MRVRVRVQPNAREECVEQLTDGALRVRVNAPAREGKANAAVTRAVARYFGVSVSRVRIVRGDTSRNKVLEII